MSHSSKNKKFSFTPQIIVRLIIFVAIVYLAITIFSQKNSDAPVLGDSDSQPKLQNYLNQAYQSLPPESRQFLENYSSSPQFYYLQDKISWLQQQTTDFPQRQFKEIQKAVVNQIYSNIIRNIDQ